MVGLVQDLAADKQAFSDSGRKERSFIPPNLLAEPLPESYVVLMGETDKRKYGYWKEKYKASQRRLEQLSEHPREREFSLKEAEVLQEGEFWVEEEEDVTRLTQKERDEKFLATQLDKANRAMYINRDNLEDELKLEQFD